MESWIEQELGAVDLGDERRRRRLLKVAQGMWRRPQASVQGAADGWAETKAAYRLWESTEATPQAILASHYEQTWQRAQWSRILLHIQDTTELDFSGRKLQGTGPLSELARRGFFLHSQYLLQKDGLPLGLRYGHIYAREDADHKEKECLQRQQGLQPRAHWIIRCHQDRTIQPPPEDQSAPTHLKAAIGAAPVLGTTTVRIRCKEQGKKVKGKRRWTVRRARKAELQIRACPVQLRPPDRPGTRLSPLTIWVVLAQEIHPPPGEDPIQWILLSDLSAPTLKKALRILKFYTQRWQIEVFHKILKSGCRVEKSQLKASERLLPRLALQLIIAWRIHYLTLLGRAGPELPSGVVFSPCEWKPVLVLFRGKAHPREEPSLAQMIQWVGQLGGHLGRKGDGPPGPQSLWKGMQCVVDFARLWQALYPEDAPAG